MNKNKIMLMAKIIESVLIFILVIAMIVMFIGYSRFKNSTPYSSLPEYDFRNSGEIFVDTNNANYSRYDYGFISPCFVGFVGSKSVTVTNSSLRHQFVELSKPFLLAAFSDISTVIEFSSESSHQEFIRTNLYEKDEFLYFEFQNEIPASAIYPAITGKTLENVYHAFNVKKLFIFCDNGTVSGVALDEDNNVATLTIRENTGLSFDALNEFSNSDNLVGFEFMAQNNTYFPVILSSVSRFNLDAYNNIGDFVSQGSQNTANILRAFSFNPNGTRFFTSQNSITYVEDIGDIIINENGDILYSETSGSIELSAISDTKKEIYSFEDKIAAATYILSRLDKNYFGEYASFALSHISYDKEKSRLTLDFEYFADGIPIALSENPAATIIFDQNSLVYASILAKQFSLTSNTFSDIPQKLLFVFSATNFNKNSTPLGFIPVYTLSQDMKSYVAKYAFIYPAAKSEKVVEK